MGRKSMRRKHTFAANRAQPAMHRKDLVQTLGANWKPGDVDERGGADAAIGGEKNGEKTLSSAASPGGSPLRNNRRPSHCNTGPDSVLTTAEDGLLARRAEANLPGAVPFLSSCYQSPSYTSSITATPAARQRYDRVARTAWPTAAGR